MIDNARIVRFEGPLFIVGMPRSGTKLLRDLLNRHPAIGVPDIESNVIPHFHDRRAEFGDLSQPRSFERFVSAFSRTIFVQRVEQGGFRISADEWRRRVRTFDFAGVLEAYYRAYAEFRGKWLWGDKSPPYMLHLPLLAELYPDARFIHIVRDVRDVCLSIRQAWGKSMVRAAQRWSDDVAHFSRDVAANGLESRVRQVHYEHLIARPEEVLGGLCDFLGLEFQPGMTTLERPSENLGTTRGMTSVVSGNAEKWRTQLQPRQIRRIESIAGDTLQRLGYDVSTPGSERLGRMEMRAAKLYDGLGLFLAYRKEHGGSLAAIRFMSRAYAQRAT